MILLLNPNTSTATTTAMVEIAGEAVASLALEGRTASFGPAMLTEPEVLKRSAEAVIAMAEEPAHGYIVAAFGDPGLEALRARVTVPVVGIGEASFLEAAVHGRFGIATTTPLLKDAIIARVAASGLPGFTGCRFTPGDPTVLTAEPAALLAALAATVRACIDDGAQAVIIGGGPLARAARALAADLPVPIIEPVPAAARLLARRLAETRAADRGGAGPTGRRASDRRGLPGAMGPASENSESSAVSETRIVGLSDSSPAVGLPSPGG